MVFAFKKMNCVPVILCIYWCWINFVRVRARLDRVITAFDRISLQKMIIDGIPNGWPACDSFFSCSRALRTQIRHSEETYCKYHHNYSYNFCAWRGEYVCHACIKLIRLTFPIHSIMGVTKGMAIFKIYHNIMACKDDKNTKCVRESGSMKQELSSSSSSVLPLRTIQRIWDCMFYDAPLEDTKLFTEVLKKHIADNSPTPEEITLPDMGFWRSREETKEEHWCGRMSPGMIKLILTISLADDSVPQEGRQLS